MLDLFTRLSHRRWPYVVAVIVVVVAVLGPQILDSGSGDGDDSSGGTSTTTEGAIDPAATSTVTGTGNGGTGGTDDTGAAGAGVTPTTPTTVDPFTPEVDRADDPVDSGSLYPDRPDRRANDHEGRVCAEADRVQCPPVRLSGFSAWVRQATTETLAPDGGERLLVKIVVQIVNRQDTDRRYRDKDWVMIRPDGIAQPSAYATPSFTSGEEEVLGNGEVFGELWFDAGFVASGACATPCTAWIAYRPTSDSDRGVWPVAITPPAPPPTEG